MTPIVVACVHDRKQDFQIQKLAWYSIRSNFFRDITNISPNFQALIGHVPLDTFVYIFHLFFADSYALLK
jgi:hypothetical protein